MSAEPLPDWLIAPAQGWTADDLDRLPEEAPRCELLDGALIVMSPQRHFHARVVRRLSNALEILAPPGWELDTEMAVRLDHHNQPEPDVVAVYPHVAPGRDKTWYRPDEVALVVEVVSPESRTRDRTVKPWKYAAAGIPHFWRVEEEAGAPVVHLFALDATRREYVAAGVARQKLSLDRPFPIDLDLGELYP